MIVGKNGKENCALEWDELEKNRVPTVLFNGTLNVSADYQGANNDEYHPTFFGVNEIDVPYELLQENNVVEVTCPDSDGYISSVTLRAFEFHESDDVGFGEVSFDGENVQVEMTGPIVAL